MTYYTTNGTSPYTSTMSWTTSSTTNGGYTWASSIFDDKFPQYTPVIANIVKRLNIEISEDEIMKLIEDDE